MRAVEQQFQLEPQQEKELTEKLKAMEVSRHQRERDMSEMREMREVRVESQSSQHSSTTQIMEDDLVKGQVESIRSHVDELMRRVNDSLSEHSSAFI